MAVSLHQLLASVTVTKAISQIQTPKTRLQDFFGMGMNGSAVSKVGGHHAGYDIFNRTRSIAQGRPPGTGPGTIAPQILGHVPIVIYRAHEKMFLLEERIFRTRPLGKNWGEVDVTGQGYVAKQEEYLSQRFKNNREFMVSRMLRGSFQLAQSGDSWNPVDSGGHFTIDYQIPAGNKSQLNMLDPNGTSIYGGDIIGTSWANAAADVITDCMQINAAFEIQHGRALQHVWCNSVVMGYLLVNTGLKNAGGTANVVFEQFTRSGASGPDGLKDPGFTVVFRALPWLTFHVYDAGLDVNGTFTKFFDDTHVAFLPDPSSDWAEMYEGSEIVAENTQDPGTERYGFAAWTERKTQPVGWELIAVDNCVPVCYIPKCIAYATAIF